MAASRFDVFHYIDRWQGQLRDLFADKPDTDYLLGVAEQRDRQLEKFLGDLWNPAWVPWTPTYNNVTTGTGRFEYQILNASLVFVEGMFDGGTVTGAGSIGIDLPFTSALGRGQSVGTIYCPLHAGYNLTGTNSGVYGAQLTYGSKQLSLSAVDGSNLAGGLALAGSHFAGAYRVISVQ